jgi:hypothetical protein
MFRALEAGEDLVRLDDVCFVGARDCEVAPYTVS